MIEQSEGGMKVRRITLTDGRYLIFYTFDDDALDYAVNKAPSSEKGDESSPESDRG